MKEIYQQIKDNVYITLSKEQERCIKKGIKNTQIRILQGKPADKILEFARAESIDLVVMESSSRFKGISHFKILGSVSRTVIERALCPVLIVR